MFSIKSSKLPFPSLIMSSVVLSQNCSQFYRSARDEVLSMDYRIEFVLLACAWTTNSYTLRTGVLARVGGCNTFSAY